MYVAGRWRDGSAETDVLNPYSGSVVGTVPEASSADIEDALHAAEAGARQMADLPAHRRSQLLEAAADEVERRVQDLADLICVEQGKTRTEALGEASRIASLLRYCAAEALRRQGEVLSMDSAAAGVGRLGFTMPEPCGVVVAITPFNYPALLVCHKVGPALAAGNAVILKPAVTTPLTALLLTECFVAAGFPEHALQCITGRGSVVGPALCISPLVRKISFTGSVEVGHSIARTAGAKRLTCELGSTAAVVVLPDADLALASREIVRSGYFNAGQVCISAQRVIADPGVIEELVDRVARGADQVVAGDPSDERTTMGPVITRSEADRIVSVIDSARRGGGVVIRGGEASGSVVAPTLVVGPAPDSSLWREELFGPAIAIRESHDLEDAIRTANDSPFGLSMSIFTQDIDRALTFARRIKSGMVHINSGTLYRIDAMPYGGVGDSGYGKEGVRYAMDEMTEHKLVIIHPGANALDASA